MDLMEVAIENTEALLDACEPFGSDIEAFLRSDDLTIPVHATFHDDPDSLERAYDIDGAVVEMDSFATIKERMGFLYLRTSNFLHNVKCQWPYLKKHLPLRQMSKKVIEEWHNVHGVQLGFADGGWMLVMSLVPEDKTKESHILGTGKMGKILAEKVAVDVAIACGELLRELPPEDMTCPSVQNNNVFDVSKFRICYDDQDFILGILEQAVQKVRLPPGVAVMRTLTRLGGKDSKPVDLRDLCHSMDHIKSVSVHVACSMTHEDEEVDLMWSRWGINNLAGRRGNVFTNLSIHEAANFQSNLDGRSMDVERQLWSIFKLGEQSPTLNFLQLYCDSPHNPQIPFFRHPVSGLLVCCGLLHKETNKAMLTRAKRYLEHFDDMRVKGIYRLQVRVEGVLMFSGTDIPAVLASRRFFNEPALMQLLKDEAMLLPFKEMNGRGIRQIHKAVVDYMVDTLTAKCNQGKRKGGYDNSWLAFQLELALEEHFHGQPRSVLDRGYSRSLGTSSTNIFSRTRQRGFIDLAPW